MVFVSNNYLVLCTICCCAEWTFLLCVEFFITTVAYAIFCFRTLPADAMAKMHISHIVILILYILPLFHQDNVCWSVLIYHVHGEAAVQWEKHKNGKKNRKWKNGYISWHNYKIDERWERLIELTLKHHHFFFHWHQQYLTLLSIMHYCKCWSYQ